MNTNRSLTLGLALLLTSATFWSCGEGGGETDRIRNVVLISMDTTRVDRLSCYGSTAQTTPQIDKLAAEGTLFENVISPVPLTLPSHSSILTGTIPPYHGVHNNLDFKLAKAIQTLPETLSENGFQTSAVIGSYVLDSMFGLDQGFGHYQDEFAQLANSEAANERPADEVTREAIGWLEKNADDPFFLFVHYYDPHDPYQPPEPFASKFKDDPYAGEIAYTDQQIGVLLEKLKELGQFENSLIVLTADHGEMLSEHGERDHSYFVYQSAVRVPLVVRMPGGGDARRISSLAGLVDIAPTILELLQLPALPHSTGHSLAAHVTGTDAPAIDKAVYCESMVPTRYGASPLLGLVTDEYKYIQSSRPELYDLSNDPGEQNNLFGEKPDIAAALKKRLRGAIDQASTAADVDSSMALDAGAAGRLESLGYVGGGVDVALEFDESKLDPKELIDFHVRDEEAIRLVVEKRFEEALPIAESLVTERPDYYHGLTLLGMICASLERTEDAVGHLQRAVAIEPNLMNAQFNLGNLLVTLDRPADAIPHFKKTLELNPKLREAQLNLANALFFTDQIDEAAKYYKRVLKGDPNHALALINLGGILTRQRKFDEAIAQFQTLIKLKPDVAGAYAGLGNALVGQGKHDEAEEYLRKALALDPGQYVAHRTLARRAFIQGKYDESIDSIKESLRIEPEQTDLLAILMRACFMTGREAEAVTAFEEALERRQNWPYALMNLAWIKAVSSNAEVERPLEAIELARQANQLTENKKPRYVDTLAIALAAAGNFKRAVITAQHALELAKAGDNQNLVNEIQSHVELFEAKKRFRPPLPMSEDQPGDGSEEGS